VAVQSYEVFTIQSLGLQPFVEFHQANSTLEPEQYTYFLTAYMSNFQRHIPLVNTDWVQLWMLKWAPGRATALLA
jgi:hypothetical protein